MMPTYAAPVLFAALFANPGSTTMEVVRSDHLSSRLIARTTAAVRGQSLRIALMLEHDPHWHTYWRNPGDAGLPTRIELELPEGVTAGQIEWPAPQRFETEGVVGYGYSGRLLLPITLGIAAGFKLQNLSFTANASWLICAQECIPGHGEYALRLPVAATTVVDRRWRAHFERSDQTLPRPLPIKTVYQIERNLIRIDFTGGDLPSDVAAWTLFSATPQLVAHEGWPTWSRIPDGLRASLPLSPFFVAPPLSADFVLVNRSRSFSFNARHAR